MNPWARQKPPRARLPHHARYRLGHIVISHLRSGWRDALLALARPCLGGHWETACNVALEAVQLFGGAGYMRENAPKHLFRDMKLWTIGGGTSEIQQLTVAKNLLGKCEHRWPYRAPRSITFCTRAEMQSLPDSPLSLWLDTYGVYTPNPVLRGDLDVDVVILGGGFTGLATAYELKRTEPGLRIAVLEAKSVGYGASGRNGSFAMTVVGLGFGPMAKLRGKTFVRDAHRYMAQAVDELDAMIEREHIDCDRTRPGFLRMATTQAYVERLQNEVELMGSLGLDDVFWLDADTARGRIHSERYLGAMWEPRLVLINPAKLVRAEKVLVERLGVRVFEGTPALEVVRQGSFRVRTPAGAVVAEKIVFATNAYSHLFPELRRSQTPAFTYMIATEPLSAEQLAPIGWHGREGVEDARNLIHYYRLTPDDRLVIGGGPVGLTYGGRLDGDSNEAAWRHLEKHLRWLFPSLAGARITHRWGGPFSITLDLTPALGYLGDRCAVYSLGCIGHGVSMSHLNGQTLRDLLLERQSNLLDCPFVNRRLVRWPPEPLRMAAAGTVRAYLQLQDWWHERHIH